MPRLAPCLVALLSLTAPAVGATTLPIADGAATSVTLFGPNRIERTALDDGTVRTEVWAAGHWSTVTQGAVTVVPEMDGTFTVTFPCPVPDAGGVTVGDAPLMVRTDLTTTTTMGGPSWSLTFTSDFGRHSLVPVGPCAARILPATMLPVVG